ncbi:nacht nucleoside triphosphatase [Metarhizium robertsii ARSEF 23]|uniref:Nacht nucleoside triphosphatase n=1 Tax=Metarhizium robertsii (strain ARSEF 23 / ATCC MYA-3075) TaxID=655844 RepID=A0A0B2X8L1_METRA|nr:nacht nucleoside triphosphatase [Metarhizium robertsii ARSEF 23]KHO11208.1 nacht nucleoside triphosphatase [Metarhizium robertsii ARSEF 23]
MASRKDARLTQIHPSPDSNIETDIDIIAIHGLDTKAPETWTWRDRCHPKNNVNWLEQEDMLPHEVGNARIFVCNWEAEMFQKSTPTNLEESAQSFLRIMRQHLEQGERGAAANPVLFIASCFGGIILIKALEIDDTCREKTLIKATRGIVFLATPFKGTSFKDVPDAALKAVALFRDQALTNLIDYVNEPKSNANELLKRFIDIKSRECYEVCAFWEARGISLFSKIYMAWLFSKRAFALWGSLVDENSATAGWTFGGQRLNRPHGRMNKFNNPECPDYMQVSREIQKILSSIRNAETPLDRVDRHIIEQYRSEGGRRLNIERLSGQRLPMEKCYINLAIVEKGSNIYGTTNDRHVHSLFARQRVETPAEHLQIELSTIFKHCQGPKDLKLSRRILIRGRAGVGKTTLCKKIVHEFINGSLSEWRNLFQRVLWVPLRNLKGRHDTDGYNMRALFNREFFSSDSDLDSAGTLLNAVAAESDKTLFLLDGLDEVSNFLAGDDVLGKTLRWLLNRPNVIITARPSVNFPQELRKLDLELETIGFYPEQVDEYIKMAFTDPRKEEGNKGSPSNTVEDIQRFLQKHQLVQSLIRIPILLDALCLTWSDTIDGHVLNTMTGLYQAIELNLWRKDVQRLSKKHDDQPISAEQIKCATGREIENFIGNELCFLECLAFTGLYHDEIHFTRQQLGCISVELGGKLMLDKTLPSLSFLRTPGLSSDPADQSYHFLHLTFQEYFAARYFVRTWKESKGPLQVLSLHTENRTQILPAVFLRKNKYTARYDIFWRFVAGLIDADGQAQQFIAMVEEEPLDLLGPAHQRLVMHCLSEISSDLQGRTICNTSMFDFRDTRKRLEERLGNWLIFGLDYTGGTYFTFEAETPVRVRRDISLKGPPDIREIFWRFRPFDYGRITEDVLWEAVEIVENPTENEDLRYSAVEFLTCGRSLPDWLIEKLMAWITDPDCDSRIRDVVIVALRRSPWQNQAAKLINLQEMNEAANRIISILKQLSLPDELQHEVETWYFTQAKRSMLSAAVDVSREWEWPDNIQQILKLLLKNENMDIQRAAIEALKFSAKLSSTTLQAISLRLRDEAAEVRRTVIHILDNQSDLADNILQEMATRLGDEDVLVRKAAAIALASRSNLADDVFKKLEALFVQEEARFRLEVMEQLPDFLYSGRILLMVATQLSDAEELKHAAVVFLKRHDLEIPEYIQRKIVDMARSGNAKLRAAAIEVLCYQRKLSQEAEQLISEGLADANKEVREAAFESLSFFSLRGLSAKALNELRNKVSDLTMNKRLSQRESEGAIRFLCQEGLFAADVVDVNLLGVIATGLISLDESLRLDVCKCLERQPNLPARILQIVTDRLEDEDEAVRASAITNLLSRKEMDQFLPVETLKSTKWQQVSKLYLVDRFRGFKKLPNEVFQLLTCWLEEGFSMVESLLWRHEEFYNSLLVGSKAPVLYEPLLQASFVYPISLYVEDGYLCVNKPEGIRKGRIDNTRCDIVAEIKKKRPPNYPLADNRG